MVDATACLVLRCRYSMCRDGQIVLNISPSALLATSCLGNDAVTFNARFGGSPFALNIPQRAVLAIYARENGAGTMFTAEEDEELTAEELAELDLEDEPARASPGTGDRYVRRLSKPPGGAVETAATDAEPTARPKPASGKKTSHLRVIK